MALCILPAIAQEKVKQTEAGLFFNNTNNFGIGLKKGSNKFMWRFNALVLNGYKNDIPLVANAVSNLGFGFGFEIGHEFKKSLAENFEFLIGYDFAYQFAKTKTVYAPENLAQRYTKENKKTTGLNLVLGFQYVLKEQLVIGAELLPGLSHSKIRQQQGFENINTISTNNYSQFNYGFTNSFARIRVAYRF
jgi:hypothetical protein